MGFAQGAGAAGNEGEEKSLEKAGGLVKGLAQSVVGVDVQLAGFVNLGTGALQQDHVDEFLGDVRLGGDENTGSSVDSIAGPVGGLGDLQEGLPVRYGGENLEGLGERAGLVATENHGNPRRISLGYLMRPGVHTSRILRWPWQGSARHPRAIHHLE